MKYRELPAFRLPYPLWEALLAEQRQLAEERTRTAQPLPPASAADFALIVLEKGLRAFAAERTARQQETRKDALVKLPSELARR
jgi:hypothetical protein